MDEANKFRAVQDEAFELFKRKNAEYGSAFRDNGPVGMVIRAGEKLKRLQTITKTQIVVSDETLRDTLLDLHNISASALLLYDEMQIDENKSCVNSRETIVSNID